MEYPAFQLNKVRRIIQRQGQLVRFERQGTNVYGEPIGDGVSIVVRGVYHETTEGHLTKSATDATTLRQKVSPMLLCLWEEAVRLLHTDQAKLNGKTYQVNEIRNMGEANIVADISLEEIQNG